MLTTVRALLGLGLLFGIGATAPSVIADDDQPRRITVTGRAEIQAVPDIATLSLGVETEALEAPAGI